MVLKIISSISMHKNGQSIALCIKPENEFIKISVSERYLAAPHRVRTDSFLMYSTNLKVKQFTRLLAQAGCKGQCLWVEINVGMVILVDVDGAFNFSALSIFHFIFLLQGVIAYK